MNVKADLPICLMFLTTIAFSQQQHITNSSAGKDKNLFIKLRENTYLSKDFVSNYQYNEFLNYLRTNNEMNLLDLCTYSKDTTGTTGPLIFNDPYFEHSHIYPGFRNFPATDISPEGAEQFCIWMAKHYRKKYHTDSLIIRLPTEEEFENGLDNIELTCIALPWEGLSSVSIIQSTYQAFEFVQGNKRKAFIFTRVDSQLEYQFLNFTDDDTTASSDTGFRWVLEYFGKDKLRLK